MRNIKFRGKGYDKDWIYGWLRQTGNEEIQKPNGQYIKTEKYYQIQDDKYHSEFVKEETIGQYTELKDRNMKKIYEGDIVKVFTNKKWRIGKIIYEHSGFTIDVTNNKELEYGRTGIIENLTEVIGNVWDNPELLEEGE